jgi:hypothetical protein
MKFILPALFLISVSAFSQKSQNSLASSSGEKQIVTSAKTYGYVSDVRLDSVDAVYAEFRFRSFRHTLTFDYGQSEEKQNNMTLTDREGRQLDFEPATIARILNFFSFNGWELAHVYNATAGGVDTFILKRK